jgi:hypothetical protein
MYHEYGHFILDHYGDSPNPDYCNGIRDGPDGCGHVLWEPEKGSIHWTEGWPDFFSEVQCRFWKSNNLPNYNLGFESHKDDARYKNVDMIEGFTASILWDIYDSAQDNQHNDDPRDMLATDFEKIWWVTTVTLTGGHNPNTIHQFWDGFFNTFSALEYRTRLWNVYAEHHITKPCPVPVPAAPIKVSPTSGATGLSTTPLLDWTDVPNATSYLVEVSTSSTFATIARSATVTTSQWTPSTALDYSTIYYWRVRAKNACGYSPWSAGRSFRTANCITPARPTLVSPTTGETGDSNSPLVDWNDVLRAASCKYRSAPTGYFALMSDMPR